MHSVPAFMLDRAAVNNGNTERRILLKQTLAGALVTLTSDRLSVEPAPPRRRGG